MARVRTALKAGGESGGTQSIRRALTVLRFLAEGQRRGVSAREIAERSALSRPTVHRILNSLIAEAIVEQDRRSGLYMLGEQLALLALARPIQAPLLTAAQDELASLAHTIGDTLFLTIRTGTDTLCLARRLGTYPIQVLSIEIGARRPLGVSSAGIAILAALPFEEAEAILVQNRARLKSYNVTHDLALQQIRRAHRDGHALRPIGLVPGTRSLSIAIRDERGAPLGAVTVSAIARRLGPGRENEVIELMRKSVANVERKVRAG
jgi:DNA-binding IclR family transcriptional regulator